jgi:alanine-synthesizing transaminase
MDPFFMFADRTNWSLEENRISLTLARVRASGARIFALSASNPAACGFTYDEDAILRALCNPAALHYTPDPRGLLSARQAVARYYAARSVSIDPDHIFLSTGTSEAYSFLFRMLCNPGDEILIPTPSYPLFDFLAEIHDVRLVRYPLIYDHGWQVEFNALEHAISARTRAVIVVHPNNPTGHYARASEIAELQKFCELHELAVIADEVFLDFDLAGETRPTFAAESRALTFTMSGLSKIAGLPQMKASWTVATGPSQSREAAIARLEVIADTYLSMNAPVQSALPVLLEQRHGFQRQMMARVRANLAELDRRLAAHANCSRLEFDGGWNAVLRFPAVRSDEETVIDLLESKGVYVHPGHFYDFPGDGHVVVSLIIPTDEFAGGISRWLSIF